MRRPPNVNGRLLVAAFFSCLSGGWGKPEELRPVFYSHSVSPYLGSVQEEVQPYWSCDLYAGLEGQDVPRSPQDGEVHSSMFSPFHLIAFFFVALFLRR